MSPETRMMGLPDGEEIMIVGQTMWTQSTSVTDRQTDRRTDGRADRQTELLSQRPCNAECRTVKTEILTPCRSETPENIKTKIALNYCVCHRPLYLANFRGNRSKGDCFQNSLSITHLIVTLCNQPISSLYPFLLPQQNGWTTGRVVTQSTGLPQTTQIHPRMCFLVVSITENIV